MVESYYNSFESNVVTVRPFNTYGPRQSARAFIPTVISQALTQDHLKLGSLDPIRDLTFAKDTAAGFIKVGCCDEAIGQCINLGYGEGYTIKEVVDTILSILGKENLPIKTDQQRIRPHKSEVMRLISNRQQAKEIAGWEPQWGLKKGLEASIAWIEKNIQRFKQNRYII